MKINQTVVPWHAIKERKCLSQLDNEGMLRQHRVLSRGKSEPGTSTSREFTLALGA